MTNPSAGHVMAVRVLPESRREVTVTSGVVGLHKLTLMPGVLGTEDGAAFIARAADLANVVYRERKRKGKRADQGESTDDASDVA